METTFFDKAETTFFDKEETTFFDKAETTASVFHVATPKLVTHECATFISGSINSKL